MTRPQKSEYNILSDFHTYIYWLYYWWYVYIVIGKQMNAENARLFALSHHRCICINSRIIENSLNVFDWIICFLSSCIWILSILNGKNFFFILSSQKIVSPFLNLQFFLQFSKSAFPIFWSMYFIFSDE